MSDLRAPFPWFGGKRLVAPQVWERFGNVQTYNEPFAGSLAVLLGRPNPPKVETVNDLNCYLANFWRALQADPDAVAFHADSPVNEADLHARHRWLVETARAVAERVMTEPEFYDAKIAGWWVWGQCLWIGSGWCERPDWTGRANAGRRARGVHVVDRKRPGQGGNDRNGNQKGLLSEGVRSQGLYDYMRDLAVRLRRVRVCCGDWQRVLTPSVTTYIGTCGVFLDPPYSHELRERCYSEDHDISVEVRQWAIENGNNPLMRIALCGYQDEHGEHMPDTWECLPWKAHGGYSRSKRAVANRDQERIWFSPHCLQTGLFAEHTA